MCGIVGWVLRFDEARGPDILHALTDMLRHRGPDGSGSAIFRTRDDQHQIAFGHRRLSIIDIDGGAQPMHSKDGSVTVIFNGEIYNYLELRDQLKERGHVFHTSSDTEVLIEAYRAFGRQAVTRLRGMFAFALWDARNEELLLVRDHFGKKPLFYTERHGGWVFASEVNALLAFPGMDTRFDESVLGEYLLNRYVPGPNTFFRSIKKVPPGCLAVWSKRGVAIERYFQPPVGITQPDMVAFDDAVRLFRATFDEAVRIRMRSDAPFGAFLSGGLDSSAVVAVMSQHSHNPIRTFSVGFPESEYSELQYARTVAAQFGTRHSELVVTPHDLADAWPEAILRRGAPVSEPSDLPILCLAKEARRSVKMVLTGEGADEFFGGYPKHAAEPWIGWYQRLVPSLVREHVVRPVLNRLPFEFRRGRTLAMAAGERNFADRMRVWFGGFPRELRDALLRDLPDARCDIFPFSATAGSALRRTLFFDQTSWLPDNLLERGDRMMMAGSVEGRMPFMDVELARVASRLPDKFLLRGLGGKAVLRSAMKDQIPEPILRRKKVGFRVPVAVWFRTTHRALLEELLRSDESETRRLCRAPVLDRIIREHVEMGRNHEKILWSMANLEMFFRSFRSTKSAYPPARMFEAGKLDLCQQAN